MNNLITYFENSNNDGGDYDGKEGGNKHGELGIR